MTTDNRILEATRAALKIGGIEIKREPQEETPEAVEAPRDHLETQFRVKGKAGRIALCSKLIEAFEGTDTPCCALVVGNPEATDLWNGGYLQDETGFRRALRQPHNIVHCPMVKTNYKGREALVWRTFGKRRSANEIASYIYESRLPATHWDKLNRQLGIGANETRYKQPICPHPIGIIILVAQDGGKGFLSQIESVPDLTIYHMDASDFEAQDGGLEPISDVAIFKHEETLPYPVDVWNGTLYGEFASENTEGNSLPPEMFIECLKTVVGSIIGNRLYGDAKGTNARQYTILVAPPQSGKDVAIDGAVDICKPAEFDRESKDFLTNDVPGYTHIGARICNCASENAVIAHAFKWKNLLNKPPEFGSVLDKAGIAGNMALLELMLGAWDSTMPVLSTAQKRQEVPRQVLFSLLTSIQPDRLLNMHLSSGLYSRIIWVTVPKFDVAAFLSEPTYGDLQQRLFAKLMALEKNPIRIKTSPVARKQLEVWFRSLGNRNYEDDQIKTRMNIITLRNALHLAWLRGESEITFEIMGKAIQISEWQLSVRANLFLSETDNDVARHQMRIRKALKKGLISGRSLQKATNASRVGTEIHERALKGLLSTQEVKMKVTSHVNSNGYYLSKEG